MYLIPGRQFQSTHVAIVPGLYDFGKLQTIQVWLSSYDDNIIADPDYAGRFFRELTPLGIRWLAQSDISIAEDDELLGLAAKSGCIGLLIGLESIHQEDLILQPELR